MSVEGLKLRRGGFFPKANFMLGSQNPRLVKVENMKPRQPNFQEKDGDRTVNTS
jgi:hypothetical protein